MAGTASQTTLLNEEEIHELISRLARRIWESYGEDGKDLVLVGIRTGGAFLARRLQKRLETLAGRPIPTGVIDINLYRDDWSQIGNAPVVGKTELPFELDEADVLLVDDVIFTGRTIRAAMDALMDFGRPKRIAVAVLVDRGGRELPITANYVGIYREAGPGETINVYLKEKYGVDRVLVETGHKRSAAGKEPPS